MTPSTSPRSPQITAWDWDAVAAFDTRRDDVFIVERLPLECVVAAMATARVNGWRSVVTAADVDVRTRAGLAELNLHCPALSADVADLVRNFLAQFEATEASLRIEVVNEISCPKFHCDHVRIRLVTTYHGPATEYVFTDNPNEIRQAPTGALVFLKGHNHPIHAHAVHHRSPAVPLGGKRLCVVLNV